MISWLDLPIVVSKEFNHTYSECVIPRDKLMNAPGIIGSNLGLYVRPDKQQMPQRLPFSSSGKSRGMLAIARERAVGTPVVQRVLKTA